MTISIGVRLSVPYLTPDEHVEQVKSKHAVKDFPKEINFVKPLLTLSADTLSTEASLTSLPQLSIHRQKKQQGHGGYGGYIWRIWRNYEEILGHMAELWRDSCSSLLPSPNST